MEKRPCEKKLGGYVFISKRTKEKHHSLFDNMIQHHSKQEYHAVVSSSNLFETAFQSNPEEASEASSSLSLFTS